MIIASPANVQRLRGLSADSRGATIVEFGLLMPVLGLLLIGTFDIGHTLYMRAVLQGTVQKTARDSALQSGVDGGRQAELDKRVRDQVKKLVKITDEDIKITRRFYRSFSKAAAAQAEPHTDTNNNKLCDGGEPFEDQNGNGVRDADGGDQGQGGAKDSVLYTVTVSYPRILPHARISGGDRTIVTATTVMNNQPYGDQGVYAAKAGKCPI